jgi:hypothetical protein
MIFSGALFSTIGASRWLGPMKDAMHERDVALGRWLITPDENEAARLADDARAFDGKAKTERTFGAIAFAGGMTLLSVGIGWWLFPSAEDEEEKNGE